MELLVLLFVLATLTALIVPWVNLVRLNGLNQRLKELERVARPREASHHQTQTEPKPEKPTRPAPEESTQQATSPVLQRVVDPPERQKPLEQPSATPAREADERTEETPKRTKVPRPAPTVAASSDSEDAEGKDWFGRVTIWVGGIALLMAGFFMVKYSIESGLVTPLVRIWTTVAFGGLLCTAGFLMHRKTSNAGNHRICQALAGAGVACFYFASYAAVHLYAFLGPQTGFLAMVGVTALAVMLSLKLGAPMALLGMVGGFITPWLMQTDSVNTAMLFTYLFLLVAGLQYLCLRRGWWGLLLTAIGVAFLWSGIIILSFWDNQIPEAPGVLLFILGLCAANSLSMVLVRKDHSDPKVLGTIRLIGSLIWSVGLAQAGFWVFLNGFAAVDLSLFTVLGIGALALAVIREKDFLPIAWLALAATGFAAVSNPSGNWMQWFLWPVGMGAAFMGIGYWRALVSDQSIHWRTLSSAACAGLVPILYANRELLQDTVARPESIWLLGLAVACALFQAITTEHFFRKGENARRFSQLSALAFFILGFGLWVAVPDDFLPHAAAGLLLSAIAYWRVRRIEASEWVILPLGIGWALLMVPNAEDAVRYFFEAERTGATDGALRIAVAWAAGLTAGWVGRLWFVGHWPKMLRVAWDYGIGTTTLIGFVAFYRCIDRGLMPDQWTHLAVSGGLTATLAVVALLLYWGFRSHKWAVKGSQALAIMAGARILLLHMLGSGAAGPSFFWNALFLQFGVPLLAAVGLALLSSREDSMRLWRSFYQIAAMVLGFLWCTFLVEDYFGGRMLFPNAMGSTQLYTYSVVWLLLAIAYQAIGLWRKQKTLHFGSLLLLLLAVSKAFLVDASELVGIFRVLSFLGLGITLMGIGFFYNKVVFTRRSAESKGDS